MSSYLDKNGLLYLWNKIKNKFASINHTHTRAQITDLLDYIHPIGSIFEWEDSGIESGSPNFSTVAHVESYFGGKWERYGEGRVTVCQLANDADFTIVGSIGGEKIHTLTIDELPRHSHQTAINTNKVYSATSGGHTFGVDNEGISPTGNTGGGQPHNNLQPYIVVYRYRRTA